LEYQLTVHVPVKMIFAAFESEKDGATGITPIKSPEYKITAEARSPVKVTLVSFNTVSNGGGDGGLPGLTLIPDTETLGDQKFKLNLVGTSGTFGKPFGTIPIAPDNQPGTASWTLDAGSYDGGDINPPILEGSFRLEGEYQGDLGGQRPEYAAVFKFELVEAGE
jgi:hypothetical protein